MLHIEEMLEWVALLQGTIPRQGQTYAPCMGRRAALLGVAAFVNSQFLQRRQDECGAHPRVPAFFYGPQRLRVCRHWFAP